jgi:hypothetical protein
MAGSIRSHNVFEDGIAERSLAANPTLEVSA